MSKKERPDQSATNNLSLTALLRKIWSYLTKRQQILLIAISITSVGTGFAATAPAIVVGNIVNQLLKPNSHRDLLMLILEFGGLLLAFALLTAGVHIALHSITPKIEVIFRHKQVLHSLQTPLDDSDKRYAAEINSLLSNGTKSASDLVKISFGAFLPSFVQVAWAIFLAIRTEWIAGVIMLSAAPLGYFVVKSQLRSQSGIRKRIQTEKARLDGALTELIHGKEIVRSLNAVTTESARIRKDAQKVADAELQHHTVMGLFDGAKLIVEGLFGVAVVGAAILLSENHHLSAGEVLTIYLLYVQFATPLRSLHRMRDEVSDSETQAAKMFDLLDIPVDKFFVRDKVTTTNHIGATKAIEAIDVVSSYSGTDRAAVRCVSVEVEEGQFVGLCGPTGSGKTTLLKCIAGLQQMDEGSVHLFGVSLNEYDPESLSSCIAYASQHPYLVAASVRENVRFGCKRDVTDDEIVEVLKSVQMWEDISRKPDGLDTDLGEEGSGLSEGQKQRIVIARLMLRRPRILLLDEATSALDNLTESAVMQSLINLKVTTLAIAHRLTTLRGANWIHVMNDGLIVQSDTFAALESTPGLFGALLAVTRP